MGVRILRHTALQIFQCKTQAFSQLTKADFVAALNLVQKCHAIVQSRHSLFRSVDERFIPLHGCSLYNSGGVGIAL